MTWLPTSHLELSLFLGSLRPMFFGGCCQKRTGFGVRKCKIYLEQSTGREDLRLVRSDGQGGGSWLCLWAVILQQAQA